MNLTNLPLKTDRPKILEVGDGAGLFGREALIRWPSAQLVGLDRDGQLHSQANQVLLAQFPDSAWERICTSLSSPYLRLPTDFDLVIGGNLAAWCAPDFAKALSLVLKPEGTVFLEEDAGVSPELARHFTAPDWKNIQHADGYLSAQKSAHGVPLAALAIETIQVGQTATFTTSFSDEDMRVFGKLSGDFNPLHFDDQYATSLGFDERVVFGLLTSALVSRLVGVHLPGLNSLIREVKLQFPNPLYRGQGVRIEGIVDLVDVPKRLLNIAVYGFRTSDGAKVIRGKVQVSVPSPSKEWRSGWKERELSS